MYLLRLQTPPKTKDHILSVTLDGLLKCLRVIRHPENRRVEWKKRWRKVQWKAQCSARQGRSATGLGTAQAGLEDLLQPAKKTHKEVLPGSWRGSWDKGKSTPRCSPLPSPTCCHVQLWDGREDVIFACQMFKELIVPRVGENRAFVTRVALPVTCRWQMEVSQLSMLLVLSWAGLRSGDSLSHFPSYLMASWPFLNFPSMKKLGLEDVRSCAPGWILSTWQICPSIENVPGL